MVGIVVKLGAGASNPYTIAFLATAVATGMRWLLDPWLGDHIPFTPYYAAICVSGLLGGASSAILTLVAGLVLGNLLFIAPRSLLLISGQEQIIGVLAYLMVGSIIAWLSQKQRHVQHVLGERVKELKTLHTFAQVSLNQDMSVPQLLQTLAGMLPAGWQYPEITAARITYKGEVYGPRAFPADCPVQRAEFELRDGSSGSIEVAYLEARPSASEGPFLAEERHLIDSLVAMLKATLERRFDHERLERSIHKYESLVANIPDVIWTADSKARTTFISPSVERVYGFTADEICAGGSGIWLGRIHPDDIESVRKAYGELFHRRTPFEVEYRIQRKDGQWIWLQDRSVTTYEENGVYYTDGIFRDITMTKQAAAALQELNETLEAQVQERTKELLQKQKELSALAAELSRTEVRERQRLATELHDNLAQHLALSKMKLSSALYDETNRPRIYREVKNLLTDALRYTRTLMSDLGPPLLGTEHDLQRAIAWVAEKMQRHGLEVTVRDDGVSKVLSEDALTATYQVVQELLFNVVKHAHYSQATISLERCGENLKVVVSDQGVGFDVSATRKPPGDGGFGLLHVQQRVASFGGSIEISSSQGKGTHATLVMPLFRPTIGIVERDRALSASTDKEFLLSAPCVSSKIRVLLVDDHPVLRQGLRSALEEQDRLQIVGEAGDGNAALDFVRQHQPDVILMDINMPKMNGIDATRAIMSEYPDTIIIGLSMHEDPKMAHAMHEAGAAEYLTKGGPFEALLEAITRHFQGTHPFP